MSEEEIIKEINYAISWFAQMGLLKEKKAQQRNIRPLQQRKRKKRKNKTKARRNEYTY